MCFLPGFVDMLPLNQPCFLKGYQLSAISSQLSAVINAAVF
jgi:hypothetical protein